MNCEKARLLIDAYMDGELDSKSKVLVSEHLTDCKPCSAFLAARQNLSKAIKLAAAHVPAPSRLGDQFRLRERRRRYPLAPLALGAAFVVGVAATLILWHPWALSSDRVAADMIEDHERAMMGKHLADVPSVDKVKLRTWFCDKGVEYCPSIKDYGGQGYQLQGGRIDMAGGRPVSVLVYLHESHLIDVFVTTPEMPGRLDVDRNGFHVRTWEDCGLNYWAVSDDTPANLTALGRLFTPRQ